jgi:hypothetical protein
MTISKNFLNRFFGQVDLSIISELWEALTEKLFTLRHIGDISNRVIHNWVKEGLVPGFEVVSRTKKKSKSGKNTPKWHRFSFLDYIWLRILIELRKFDLSFLLLKKIMDNLYYNIDFSDYMVLLKDNIVQLEKILTQDQKDDFHAALANADKDEELMAVHSTMNFLYFLLCDIIIHKEAVSLIIDNQGNVHPFSNAYAENLMSDKEYVEAISGHHVSISLSKIVAEFISNSTELDSTVLRLKLLTAQEIRIINLIRKERPKELNIRFTEQGKPERVELTYSKKVSPDTKIIDMIFQRGYHSISIETADGKVVYCKNTRKIKL